MADRTTRSVGATSVYRYYDHHDFLIYVGITGRGTSRGREHGAHSAFWPFVVRQEVDHLPTRDDALAHERELIQLYRPPFNVQHNPDAAASRAAYLAWTEAQEVATSPEHLFRELRRMLPLAPLERSPDGRRLILRAMAEHFPLARLIEADPAERLPVAGQSGRVTSVETRGLFALVHLWGKRELPRPVAATARLKVARQKPLAFRIASVAIVREVAA